MLKNTHSILMKLMMTWFNTEPAQYNTRVFSIFYKHGVGHFFHILLYYFSGTWVFV